MPNNRNNILVDPRGEYYHDAYPAQQQEPPGLESRMQPRPDTGEESYRGHGRLLGRKALITGGDSGIGRAVAIAFAREGADIAVNYLPAEQPDAASLRTLLDGEGWYTKTPTKVVMVVCRKNETGILFRVIKEVDPHAFMTFGSVMGVYGLGFEALKK